MSPRIPLLTLLSVAALVSATAQTFRFDFSGAKTIAEGFVGVGPQTVFSEAVGYGYDLQPAWDGRSTAPFYFSVLVPDGNYRISVTIGSKSEAGSTTVRAESRRLFVENLATRKGEFITETFVVNKRNPVIEGSQTVKLKPGEDQKLNWDDKLTLEFNGDCPRPYQLVIEPAPDVPTVFLCGNSTVVDNDYEPYTSWGQMITRFLGDGVAVANYAESGLSANTFIGGRRLDKALTQMKKGDYIFIEFGHNDQKQKGPGKGAYYEFSFYIKQFIDQALLKGAKPVLVTPTRRRQFDKDGHIKDTHADFPAAVRDIARREGLPLIDLQEMTKTLCEAMGVDDSKLLYVHYAAGTYPGQDKELKDNSHFSAFGAYEVAKCILQGIRQLQLPIADFIRPDFGGFDPARPDAFASFRWNRSVYTKVEKPAGS